MIIFRNPGLIDLLAVTTMGVSIKLPDAFGRFGTGFKYGVASVLRGGGSVMIYRGKTQHAFSLERQTVGEGDRAREFDFVCLDGVRIGFTTQLGVDWKPWMVLREFGCNALDEAGDFWLVDDEHPMPELTDDHTVIAILWPDLETAYKQRGDLFLTGEPLFANDKIRILPGPSAHLFYRGIRVFKTEKPCHFTYDIIADQALTEDRTLAGSWSADRLIRDTLLEISDPEIARQAITTGKEYHESTLNFADAGWGVSASTHFVKAATIARESDDKEKLNDSAKTLAIKAQRQQQADEHHSGRIRIEHTPFTEAIGHLMELGMEFDDSQKFVEVGELSGEARTILESGTIFMLRSLGHADSRTIAGELIKRWVDLQPGVYSADQAVALLAPKLLDAVPECRRQRERAEAAEAKRLEAEAAEAAKVAAAAEEAALPSVEAPPAAPDADPVL